MNPILTAVLLTVLGGCGIIPTVLPPSDVLPAPLISPAISPAPLHASVPSLPVAPPFGLSVGDESSVTVVSGFGVLNIKLSPGKAETYMRLILPSGTVSPVTTGPDCECIALYSGLKEIRVSVVSGVKVETSDSKNGPWNLAAFYK
jgi:hypothetical protein